MTTQAPVIAMILKDTDNATLAALNNMIQWTGVVPKINTGYRWALEAGLITEAGHTAFDLEDTRDALAYEVNRRVAAGTFE